MQATRDAEQSLKHLIATDSESLLRTLCTYVIYARLAEGSAVLPLAHEILNDAYIEAAKHPERLEQVLSQRAWLLGIASNLIKRRQVELAKRNRHEPLMRDLLPQLEDSFSDGELSDLLDKLRPEEADTHRREHETVEELLSLVSPDDAAILRLAILHELDGNTLAKELGIKPGTARMRLHRAIRHLQSRIKAGRHE